MRLDHIAYRVKDRYKTFEFFQKAFGYRLPHDLPEGFTIEFKNNKGEIESTTKCLVLVPAEKIERANAPWIWAARIDDDIQEYHMAPEIFVSDGESENGESIVSQWVKNRNNVGGIHHMAFQVDSVSEKMQEWTKKGYAEFASDKPLSCPGLTQVFTKPSELTGVIYEFIERGKHGFCRENVRDLMLSTKEFS